MKNTTGGLRLPFVPLLCAGLVWLLAVQLSIPEAAAKSVPDKSSLKARVDQFYAAYQKRDQKALVSILLPQMFRCEPVPDDIGALWDDPSLQVVSWKIRSIRFDGEYVDEPLELCPGETFQATSGATVVVLMTGQVSGGPIETDENELSWLYVNGTWYLFPNEC